MSFGGTARAVIATLFSSLFNGLLYIFKIGNRPALFFDLIFDVGEINFQPRVMNFIQQLGVIGNYITPFNLLFATQVAGSIILIYFLAKSWKAILFISIGVAIVFVILWVKGASLPFSLPATNSTLIKIHVKELIRMN